MSKSQAVHIFDAYNNIIYCSQNNFVSFRCFVVSTLRQTENNYSVDGVINIQNYLAFELPNLQPSISNLGYILFKFIFFDK